MPARWKGDNRGSNHARPKGKQYSQASGYEEVSSQRPSNLIPRHPENNAPSVPAAWSHPQSIRSFFPTREHAGAEGEGAVGSNPADYYAPASLNYVANRSICSTNEYAADLKSNCRCVCHNTQPDHSPAEFRPDTLLLDCSTQSHFSSESVSLLFKIASNMEDSQVSATGSTATAGDKLQNNMLASAIGRISELEKGVVALDRENRDKNIRFINAPEEGQDNCIIKVANMIKNNNLVQHAHNLPLNDIVRAIENAHRIGKVIVGHNRHILVKFHSNVYRDEVMRMFKACGKKPVE